MRGHFYAARLPETLREKGRIVINEMINILLVLRLWGKMLQNQGITIWCDNSAVVEVVTRNRTRDCGLSAILRDILMTQAKYNIQLQVKHVRGEQNPIADALSRVHQEKCLQCIDFLISKNYEQTMVHESDLWLTEEYM